MWRTRHTMSRFATGSFTRTLDTSTSNPVFSLPLILSIFLISISTHRAPRPQAHAHHAHSTHTHSTHTPHIAFLPCGRRVLAAVLKSSNTTGRGRPSAAATPAQISRAPPLLSLSLPHHAHLQPHLLLSGWICAGRNPRPRPGEAGTCCPSATSSTTPTSTPRPAAAPRSSPVRAHVGQARGRPCGDQPSGETRRSPPPG